MYILGLEWGGVLVDSLYSSFWPNVGHACIAVDYFAIIAGFFFFLKTDFAQNFWNFAKKKFLRLMPLVYFSIFLYWIFSFFTPIEFLKYENIFSLLNISNCGLTLRYGNNSCTWFVSALFWSMCFYFYLSKVVNRKLFNLIIACIIFFSYAFLLHTSGLNFVNISYVFNLGMIRVLGGLAVGYFISMIYQENIDKIRNFTPSIVQKLAITALEIYLFLFIFIYFLLFSFA